jgi:hypothetical protein
VVCTPDYDRKRTNAFQPSSPTKATGSLFNNQNRLLTFTGYIIDTGEITRLCRSEARTLGSFVGGTNQSGDDQLADEFIAWCTARVWSS